MSLKIRGREGERERGREGGRERGREGEGEREGGREGEREEEEEGEGGGKRHREGVGESGRGEGRIRPVLPGGILPVAVRIPLQNVSLSAPRLMIARD
eukprot:510135-Hanusia_phi.AAC.3